MSILDDAFALITTPIRAIGTILPDVVVEELHRDELVITSHPVETGAPISDHAFKLPQEVEIRCGWSNSSAGFVGYVELVYNELLALQQSRVPFTVFTGKRVYQDMLIRSLQVTTDETSEWALMVTAGLQQVIIANTATTSQTANASPSMSSRVGSTIDFGTKQLTVAGPIQAAGG